MFILELMKKFAHSRIQKYNQLKTSDFLAISLLHKSAHKKKEKNRKYTTNIEQNRNIWTINSLNYQFF